MDSAAPKLLLQLTSLTRQFSLGEENITVLSDIHLDIYSGEMVAIVGQSGSGKSTLMNILGCLDRPSSGSYQINGREIHSLSNDELAALRREYFGFIFQRYHLLPSLSALENVALPAIYSGLPKNERHKRALQLLTRLGLETHTQHRPAQLSGGQQQRVSIARALMNGGNIILADEPTGALDSHSGEEMMRVLYELHQHGHTIILITHDMHIARYAERIIEIHDGKIISDSRRPASDPVQKTGARDIDNYHVSIQTTGNAQSCTTQTIAPQRTCGASPHTSNKVDPVKIDAPLISQYTPPIATQTILTHDTHAQKTPIHRKKFSQGTWGRLSESFKIAWIAMITHRMRTFLTMLGIIIGITSVVSIVALGAGAQKSITDTMRANGTNTIDIYRGKDWGDNTAATIKTLTPHDVTLLQTQFYVDSVTPHIPSNQTLRYGNTQVEAQVNGVNHQYFRVRNIKMAQGAAFGPEKIYQHAQTIVIDDNTRKRLFKEWEEPLGKIIMVGKLPCVVIAVTEKQNNLFAHTAALEVFIPYTTAMGRLVGQPYVSSITVRVREGFANNLVEQQIIKLLTLRHGVKDFFTSSSDAHLKMMQKSTRTFTLLISALAVISLIVGGIGVMNIMLVSVTERTHEIGIRVAVGARQRDILQQFLIEAMLVCLAGGVIGIALSYAISIIFALFTDEIMMQFSAPALICACLCATLVGAIFGFLPARNAARLLPIEALARE